MDAKPSAPIDHHRLTASDPAQGGPHREDFRGRFLRGAAWSTALRWAVRAIGIVSTAVLARLLTPADFGLVAMAMVVIAFLDVWADTGVEYALIHNQRATREHYNTGWTLRLGQGLVVAAAVAAIAPFAALYFKEPRVTPLLWVLSGGIVVFALRNIGTVEFRKELRFDKEFRLLVTTKLLTVAITIAMAWYFRSYWALVIGILAGYSCECIGSYVIHPFRPRLSLRHAREFTGYWLATLANGLGHFLDGKLDEILVGRFGSTAQMGLYSVASEVGQLPVTELAAPLNKTLLPTLSKLQEEPDRIRAAYLNYQRALALIVVPAGVGLALVADPFVRVLLGEQWLWAVPLLQLFAILAIFKGSYLAAANAFVGLGRPGLSARLAWLGAGLLLVGALVVAPKFGVMGIAAARVGVGVVSLGAGLFWLTRLTGMSVRDLSACFFRPMVGVGVMGATLLALPDFGLGAFAELSIKVALGAGVYAASVLAVWLAAGSPEGPERLAVRWIAGLSSRAPREVG